MTRMNHITKVKANIKINFKVETNINVQLKVKVDIEVLIKIIVKKENSYKYNKQEYIQ